MPPTVTFLLNPSEQSRRSCASPWCPPERTGRKSLKSACFVVRHSPRLRCLQPKPNRALGEFDRTGDAVEDRDAVLVERVSARFAMPAQPSTIASAGPRGRRIRSRSAAGRSTRAPRGRARQCPRREPRYSEPQAVAGEVVFDCRNRAGKSRDDSEAAGERLAIWKAASPIPMTGASATQRAASSPVSSKQAMI